MSNYSDEHDKIAVQLKSLYEKHRKLDDSIINRYNKFATDSEINMLKTKKLFGLSSIFNSLKNIRYNNNSVIIMNATILFAFWIPYCM